MKIALICDSLLLDRSLEMYLKEYLTSYKMCDFAVATQPVESQKPVFLIGNMEGAHLKIPFTKELLLKELESFYYALNGESKSAISPRLEREIEEIRAFNQTRASIVEPLKIQKQTENMNLDFNILEDLNIKLETILRRYAEEIKEVILEHSKEKRG